MKRRVLVVTEATYNAIVRALNYAIETAEFADYDGDHDEADARSFERAKIAIADAPVRDVEKDRKAIRNLTHAACENSCSCVDLSDGHAADCFVMTERHSVDRAVAVCDLFAKR